MGSQLKHDEIISDLEERLRQSKVNYGLIVREQEYDYGRIHGEIDLYAVKTIRHKNGKVMKIYVLDFEAKSANRRKYRQKARKQLIKANYYLDKFYQPTIIKSFYVTIKDYELIIKKLFLPKVSKMVNSYNKQWCK